MKVAVIGAGEMGRGIALVFASSKFEVALEDAFPQALEKAKAYIEENLKRSVEKGNIKKGEDQEILGRIKFTSSLEEAVKGVDIVVEAVPEIVNLKQEIFEKLDKLTPENVILATNTSNIKISEISKNVNHKERVIGMHFFNPANRMKLVEVIKSEYTSDEIFNKTFEISMQIGKVPVKVLKDSPGFIVNRINAPDMLFFCKIIDMGIAKPEEVDAFAKEQGLPMGPYELMDFVGLDVVIHSMDYYAETISPEYRECNFVRELVNKGFLGKKTGKGIYDWSSGRANIPKAEPTDKVSLMDLFSIEINEAIKLIEEKVAVPDDIETAVKLGLNRPFGPISVAKSSTTAEIKKNLEDLASRFKVKVFEPTESIKNGKMKELLNIKSFQEESKEKPKEAQKSIGTVSEAKAVRRYETLYIEKMENYVAKLVLNRPKHNLINTDLLNDLEAAIKELWEDKEIRVVIITGSNENFSAGAELSQFIPGMFDFVEYSRKGERVFKLLQEIPKVVIAEIKKYALGGGFEMALSCDIRVSTPDAQIGFPEVTLGLIPAWSGSQRLAKLIGMSRAADLILTGRKFTGKEAYEMGIVTHVYDNEKVDSETIKLAESISLGTSPIAVALAKRLINRGSEISYDNGLEMESLAAGILYGTEDLKEGISAMLQKRKPEFQGK